MGLLRSFGKSGNPEARPSLFASAGLLRFRQRRLAGHLRGSRFPAAACCFTTSTTAPLTEIAMLAGCACSEDGREQAGMGVAVGDYDGDGWFDIFKTNFADDTCNLYHNNRRRNLLRMWHSAAAWASTPVRNWGCRFCRLRQRWLAGHHSVNGHVYPEVDSQDWVRLQIPAKFTGIWVMANSRTSPRRWVRGLPSDTPAAVAPSETTITTAT